MTFQTRRQEAQTLRQYFTFRDVAKLMQISAKAVWMHCTSRCPSKFQAVRLGASEIENYKLLLLQN